ncbi:uncharacterized protein LOC143050878 [Mytilus galloprovincialis]|uniref:uncharacterized protein LOC143050878 n=1 Tax=Mytilus galloprovincialis TaxID=29158 RepID=UPI003F7C05A6
MNISSTDQCPEDLITQNVDDYVLSMSREIVKKIWPFVQTTSDDLNQTTSYIDECADDTFAYEEQFESSIQSSDDEQSEVFDTGDEDDHKYQYSCAVAWNGLKMMVERDAERENDGLAILFHWRIDMIQFFNNNHNKYLILGHRLLSAVNGWLPSRLIEDLIWNSTANLTGLPGNNLALDLVNEFLNNEFKTNLKNFHGQYSDSQISRCSKIAGSLGKGIEEVFQTAIIDKYVHKSKSNSYNNSKGIAKFVNTYMKEDLFQKIKHRRHTGYENFKKIINVKNMNALHKRLIKDVLR